MVSSGTRGSGVTSGWKRLVLKVLGHPWFGTLVWSTLLVMSGLMVLHNVVLRSWGVGTFDSITAYMEREGERGRFANTPVLDAEGKPTFLQYARTPAGRFMHMLPAGLWSVIAPLQVSPNFRARHRTAHRRLGRLFMFMSVSMAFGVVPIVLTGASKFGYSVFESGLMFVCAAYFLVVGLLAVHHARNKNFRCHRAWILRHVAIGYSVHMQRLLGSLTWWIYPFIVPGYTDLTEEGSQIRTNIFLAYFCGAVLLLTGSMEVWLRYTSPSGKPLQLVQEEREDNAGKAH